RLSLPTPGPPRVSRSRRRWFLLMRLGRCIGEVRRGIIMRNRPLYWLVAVSCGIALLACGPLGEEPSPTAPPSVTAAVTAAATALVSPAVATPSPVATATAIATRPGGAGTPTATGVIPFPTSTAQPTATGVAPLATSTAQPPAAPFDPQRVALGLEEVARGLKQPLFVTHAGDGSGRLFVAEKGGTIRTLPDGRPFLDIGKRVRSSGREQGLLG